MSHLRLRLCVVIGALIAFASIGGAHAASTELFISEYIEGSSNNKALEIYNGTGAAIDLAANSYSVQMFFNGNPISTLTINLTGTVAAGDVYVLAQSAASPVILAQADQTNGSGWFNGDDAITLRRGTTVIDSIGQIGFDPGTEWGTGATSTADNTLTRKPSIEAGDTNGTDVFDPAVEWNGFANDTFNALGCHPAHPCSDPPPPGDAPPAVASTSPSNGAVDVANDANVTINFTEPVTVTGAWHSISCTTSGAHTATVSGGPTSYTLNPDSDFVSNETCTVTVFATGVSDTDTADPPDNMTANHSFSFSTAGLALRIHQIQGMSHLSPYAGQRVSGVPGVVTHVTSNGFYFQDPNPDSSNATSEALFVFTVSAPAVVVGTAVAVSGTVTEFRPGGAATNLTTTEIVSPQVTPGGPATAIPATVIGTGGRVPPNRTIDDDSPGDVEAGSVFDPANDGIDFYESLEATFVQINNTVAVGPTNSFGEVWVLGDDGANAVPRTSRGGIVIEELVGDPVGDYRDDDFNPERIQLDDAFADTPDASVGDRLGTVVGMLDYNFGNFEVNVTAPAFVLTHGLLQREVATAPGRRELSIGTFNVENLAGNQPDAKYNELAEMIVNNLAAPDIIGLEEIQDNNGATGGTGSPVVDADVTLDRLVAAIQAAGGPTYAYRQINPVAHQDGGEPGGNIRVGFLFRTDRGVSFVDRPGGTSTTPNAVVSGPTGPQLLYNPGRIDPTNAAWNSSRKPLVGEFLFDRRRIFVVVNHFNSKGGDQPIFGRFQPPVRPSEVQRHQQAALVNDFVADILALDRQSNVVVLGDINDFEFSETVEILKGDELVNLMDTLPKSERYSYVFEGNSQVLDQILVSSKVLAAGPRYDVVHVNSEFFVQVSDHDPSLFVVRPTGRTHAN